MGLEYKDPNLLLRSRATDKRLLAVRLAEQEEDEFEDPERRAEIGALKKRLSAQVMRLEQ